jgi:hypothetical protein
VADEGFFFEPSGEDRDGYLDQELANGVTRRDLIEAMEKLLLFTRGATFKWENEYYALVYATVARSARTFKGVCMLLEAQLPAQAAMLTRTLFEDVIVAHWLVLNEEDSDWLVERFLRHREAIALHQRHRQAETSWGMEPPISAPDDLEDRAEALRGEFGKEAQKNWWDPGKEGKGEGQPVGLRKVVRRLEKAAEEHKRFHPRFAGGEEPLLARMDLVINKWLSQCIHHTAIGLPFAPTREEAVEAADPMFMVGFSASWLFAQQIYLMFEINHMPYKDIDTVWYLCMATFGKVHLSEEEVEELLASWAEHYGEDPE